MSAMSCLLYLEKNAWQVHSTESGAQQSDRCSVAVDQWPEQADAIATSILEVNTSGRPIVIALGYNLCLPAIFPVSSPRVLRKPQLLHYQQEELIPWSAEEYVSDFAAHRTHAFTVAAQHEHIERVLVQLEKNGIFVAAITPLSMLAVKEHLKDSNLPPDHTLLWQHEGHVEIVAIRQHLPWSWRRSTSDEADLTRNLQQARLESSDKSKLICRSMSESLADSIGAAFPDAAFYPDSSLIDAALKTSDLVSRGIERPLIDLQKGNLKQRSRHDALRKQVSRLKIAAAFLALSCAIAFWCRSETYRLAATDTKEDLKALFVELFPERSRSIPEKVGSEIAKNLRALKATRSSVNGLPSPTAADVILNRLLHSLPKELRFRLPEIHIEQAKISLGAEVQTNSDADKLASALRENGFTVSAPRTRRLADRGFGVRITAESKMETD